MFNIEQDTFAPAITLSSSSLIDCFNPIIPVDATVNSSGSINSIWTATSGGVIEGANTGLSVNVSSAGSYEILISDQSSINMDDKTRTGKKSHKLRSPDDPKFTDTKIISKKLEECVVRCVVGTIIDLFFGSLSVFIIPGPIGLIFR